MKFKNGEAVYNTYHKVCGIIISTSNDPCGYKQKYQDGFDRSVGESELRSLHETPGFYVPREGDVTDDESEFFDNYSGWERMKAGEAIRTNVCTRFSLPFEALESEKWARRMESLNEQQCGEVMECSALFANYVNPSSLALAKARLAESAPGEVLHMVAALLALSEDTNDYADDCVAEGFILGAEQPRQRACDYERSAAALCEIWGVANTEVNHE